MPQRLAQVALLVRDYDEALAYFTGRLGFRVVEDTPLGTAKRWVVIAPPGPGGARLLLARAATPEQERTVGRQTGGRVFLFLHTDSFRRDYEAFRARGVAFIEEPREESYGTVAVFEDLYGNRWDLVQPRVTSAAADSRAPSSPAIPVLRSERLILRAFESRDVDPYAAMMADPEVTRFLGDGRPLSRVDAWRQIAILTGHWTLRGFGLWAVEEQSTGRFVGRIGCFEPEGWPGFEIGYVLARDAWGRGYAREGVAASLRHAHETLGRRDIISIIRPANTASIRVATAFGAVPSGTVEFFGAPSVIYRYPQT